MKSSGLIVPRNCLDSNDYKIVNLSCQCQLTKRSFSSMKRLKIPLRSAMMDERLISLTILHVHKHKDVDINGVITAFARLMKADVSPFACKPLDGSCRAVSQVSLEQPQTFLF